MKKFPVLITLDLDGAVGMQSIHPKNHMFWSSMGDYGPRVGIYRVLELLKKEKILATVCVVGKLAEQYPKLIKQISDDGHELAVHGYEHKPYVDMDLKEEKEDIIKTREIIEKITGKKPVGNRTPLWNPSKRTIRILDGLGFKWNSDFLNEDIPYYHEVDGRTTSILEIPPSAALNDWAQLIQFRLPPSDMKKVWISEFDGLYKEKKCFVLTLHCFDIGRNSRLKVLKELIRHIKRHKNIAFMRCCDVVDGMHS